jgi:hypothetical protein
MAGARPAEGLPDFQVLDWADLDEDCKLFKIVQIWNELENSLLNNFWRMPLFLKYKHT